MPKKINIPIDIISRHFHLPIDDAAQVLGACVTVLKKTCRKHGIRRWPHQRLRYIDRRLRQFMLKPSLDDAGREELERLKRQRLDLLNGLQVELIVDQFGYASSAFSSAPASPPNKVLDGMMQASSDPSGIMRQALPASLGMYSSQPQSPSFATPYPGGAAGRGYQFQAPAPTAAMSGYQGAGATGDLFGGSYMPFLYQSPPLASARGPMGPSPAMRGPVSAPYPPASGGMSAVPLQHPMKQPSPQQQQQSQLPRADIPPFPTMPTQDPEMQYLLKRFYAFRTVAASRLSRGEAQPVLRT